MTNPNWSKFAQLTATPELFAIIDALGVEVPPEGRPRKFQGYRREWINGFLMPGAIVRVNVEHYKDTGAHGFVVCADGSSRYLSSARDIRRALRIPVGSPTDKALLRFLAWWGLEPPDKARPVEPNDQTKTII